MPSLVAWFLVTVTILATWLTFRLPEVFFKAFTWQRERVVWFGLMRRVALQQGRQAALLRAQEAEAAAKRYEERLRSYPQRPN